MIEIEKSLTLEAVLLAVDDVVDDEADEVQAARGELVVVGRLAARRAAVHDVVALGAARRTRRVRGQVVRTAKVVAHF